MALCKASARPRFHHVVSRKPLILTHLAETCRQASFPSQRTHPASKTAGTCADRARRSTTGQLSHQCLCRTSHQQVTASVWRWHRRHLTASTPASTVNPCVHMNCMKAYPSPPVALAPRCVGSCRAPCGGCHARKRRSPTQLAHHIGIGALQAQTAASGEAQQRIVDVEPE